MTINHIFLLISTSKFANTRAFYRTALKPLGYTELLAPHDQLVGLGSDFPYLFLKAIPDEEKGRSTHLAIQAASMFLPHLPLSYFGLLGMAHSWKV